MFPSICRLQELLPRKLSNPKILLSLVFLRVLSVMRRLKNWVKELTVLFTKQETDLNTDLLR